MPWTIKSFEHDNDENLFISFTALLFSHFKDIYIFFFIEFYLPCLTFQIEKIVFQCKTAYIIIVYHMVSINSK